MRTRAALVVVAALALVGVACSDDGDESGRPTTSTSPSSSTTTTAAPSTACDGCPVYGETDTAISATAGERFVIELESNRSTGYQWSATSSDETVVRQESSEYVAPESDALGAPGQERFVFVAEAPGSATLTLLYARGFEDGADAQQVVYTVTVG